MPGQNSVVRHIYNQDSIKRLPPMDKWVEPEITVIDEGWPIKFHIFDVLKYHGLDSIGGCVLGFRLLQRAFALLHPQGRPPRRLLSLFTSFPGYGARDCFELVTRMVLENRYSVDPAFCDMRASDGVTGRCYFRFSMQGKSVALTTPEGVPDREFIELGRAIKVTPRDSSEFEPALQKWIAAKFGLATLLLGLSAEQSIRVLES